MISVPHRLVLTFTFIYGDKANPIQKVFVKHFLVLLIRGIFPSHKYLMVFDVLIPDTYATVASNGLISSIKPIDFKHLQ